VNECFNPGGDVPDPRVRYRAKQETFAVKITEENIVSVGKWVHAVAGGNVEVARHVDTDKLRMHVNGRTYETGQYLWLDDSMSIRTNGSNNFDEFWEEWS